VLESAESQVDAEKIAATVAVEDVPEEIYEKRGLGVLAWIGIGWLVFIIGIALLAPLLPLKDPMYADFLHPNAAAFSPGHLLGTDATGRDVLSRVLWGARASLLISICSVLLGTLVGGFLGLLAGFRGRGTDSVLSGFTNILLAFPQLVLALTLVAVFAPLRTASNGNAPPAHDWAHRIFVVVLAVGIVSIPILARITRASAISWTQREFVTAARAQGAADKRVMFREVLPNVLPAMLSIALLGVAVVLILEGSLAVFGVSVQEPNPSWGNMIYSQLSDLSASPAVWLVPSILIFVTVLSLNYLGDVVRSRFDVRESVL
jgi:peptide/nickel transport system permease protein